MYREIDVLVSAAKICGAEDNDMELFKIRRKAMALDKENKYNSEYGLDATLNYHTINMRSRFKDIRTKDRNNNSVEQKTEPYFYRVERGKYWLLKNKDIKLFIIALENNLDVVYKDLYSLQQLENEVEKIK